MLRNSDNTNQTPIVQKEILRDLTTITKGAGIIFLGTVSGKALIFLYTIFLTRLINAEGFGLYTLGITIILFISSIADLGLGVSSTRFIAIHESQQNQGRTKGVVILSGILTFIASSVIMLIVLFFSQMVAISIFKKPEMEQVISILSLSLPFECLMRIFLRATQGLKIVKYTAITEQFLWIALRFVLSLLFFAIMEMNLVYACWSYTVSSVVCCGVAFFYLNRHIPLFHRDIAPIFEIRRMLRFSIPMVVSIFLGNVSRQIDILMLGLFVSATNLGIYAPAVRLIMIAEFVYQLFNPIFNPIVSELCVKKDFSKLGKLLHVITRWTFTFSLPVFMILFFYPDFFLNLFGDEFREASSVLRVLVVVHLFSSISSLPSTMIFMSGRSDITAKNNILILIINIALNFFLIPLYGILGAAIATGISLLFIGAIRIVEVYHLMRVQPFHLSLWKPLVSALIAMIVILAHNYSGISNTFSVLGSMALFIFLYLILIVLFRLDDEDLYIMTLIKNRLLVTLKIFS